MSKNDDNNLFSNIISKDDVILVDEKDGVKKCYELLQNDLIFAGGSGGCVVAAIEQYVKFFEDNKDNLMTCEYLIPTVVSDLITEGKVTCDILSTTSVWYGVTYKDDKEFVVSSLKALVDKGEYPKGIWK